MSENPEPVRCARCGLPGEERWDLTQYAPGHWRHASADVCAEENGRQRDEASRLLGVARERLEFIRTNAEIGDIYALSSEALAALDRAKKSEERM